MEEDMFKLFKHFSEGPGLTFPNFMDVWRRMEYQLLHCLLIDEHDDEDTALAYQDLYATLLACLSRPLHVSWKIGAIYSLYVIFCSQPLPNPCPIRVGPFEWRQIRQVTKSCEKITSLCDVGPIVEILASSGAFVFAAYAGNENFASIARAARLYNLHDLSAARGPSAPLVDLVMGSLFPHVASETVVLDSHRAMLDLVDEGPKRRLVQSRSRKEAMGSRKEAMGSGGVKRGRVSPSPSPQPASAVLLSSEESVEASASSAAGEGERGGGGTGVAPAHRSVGARMAAFNTVVAPRDSEQQARSRRIGATVLHTCGLRRLASIVPPSLMLPHSFSATTCNGGATSHTSHAAATSVTSGMEASLECGATGEVSIPRGVCDYSTFAPQRFLPFLRVATEKAGKPGKKGLLGFKTPLSIASLSTRVAAPEVELMEADREVMEVDSGVSPHSATATSPPASKRQRTGPSDAAIASSLFSPHGLLHATGVEASTPTVATHCSRRLAGVGSVEGVWLSDAEFGAADAELAALLEASSVDACVPTCAPFDDPVCPVSPPTRRPVAATGRGGRGGSSSGRGARTTTLARQGGEGFGLPPYECSDAPPIVELPLGSGVTVRDATVATAVSYLAKVLKARVVRSTPTDAQTGAPLWRSGFAVVNGASGLVADNVTLKLRKQCYGDVLSPR